MEERVRCWSSGLVTSALIGVLHVEMVIASFLILFPTFLGHPCLLTFPSIYFILLKEQISSSCLGLFLQHLLNVVISPPSSFCHPCGGKS